MEVLEIENSSAIAKISFDYEENQVGVAYTYKPEMFYLFTCEDIQSVREKIDTTESVGKYISQLRKEGTLASL